MKRFWLISMLIGLGTIVAVSQDSIVTIPDTAFLQALIDVGVDTNGDSLISYGEAEAISKFSQQHLVIGDMTGIEAFINLELFSCHCCGILSLDFSNNPKLNELILSSLTECRYNPGTLESLNVSNNTALMRLFIEQNKLTSLDISNNIALVDLTLAAIPSLNEVCVWDGFFSETINVDTTNSPNVYFTTECSISSGVVENSQTGLLFYPNPTNNLLTIEIGQSEHYYVEITSLNGQLLYNKVMEGNTCQIDLSSFESGVYFITIRSKDFVTTRKIVKL